MNFFNIALLLLAIDSIFVYSVSGKYKNMIYNIQSKSHMNINIFGVILSYSMLLLAYYWFIYPDLIILKQNNNTNITPILINSFILGIVLYGVYDFTNMAIFKNWNIGLAILDVLWGGILFTLLTYINLNIL
jgi:uncharacterized membrane protein